MELAEVSVEPDAKFDPGLGAVGADVQHRGVHGHRRRPTQSATRLYSPLRPAPVMPSKCVIDGARMVVGRPDASGPIIDIAALEPDSGRCSSHRRSCRPRRRRPSC